MAPFTAGSLEIIVSPTLLYCYCILSALITNVLFLLTVFTAVVFVFICCIRVPLYSLYTAETECRFVGALQVLSILILILIIIIIIYAFLSCCKDFKALEW